MCIFNELKASLEEAVEIKKGTAEVSHITRYSIDDVNSSLITKSPKRSVSKY